MNVWSIICEFCLTTDYICCLRYSLTSRRFLRSIMNLPYLIIHLLQCNICSCVPAADGWRFEKLLMQGRNLLGHFFCLGLLLTWYLLYYILYLVCFLVDNVIVDTSVVIKGFTFLNYTLAAKFSFLYDVCLIWNCYLLCSISIYG